MFFLVFVCLLSFYGFALLFANLSEIQVNLFLIKMKTCTVLELLLLFHVLSYLASVSFYNMNIQSDLLFCFGEVLS